MSENLDLVNQWKQTLVVSFTQAFGQIIDTVPRLLGMVVVLLLGYFIAKMLGRLSTALCERIGLQTAAERSGLAGSMKQVGIHRSVPFIVGALVFWGLMCVFLTAAFNILGLPTVSTAMEQIVSYIPKLLVAAVVVVLGLLVASFLRGVVATSADRVGLSYAEYLANGFYYVLAGMTFMAAADHLGLKFDMFNYAILIAFGALSLGFGLALGLGGRDVMAGILAGYYTRQRLHPGDVVTVAGMSGTVREVGPVATVIETEEDGLLNRHTIPNTKMLNEAVR
ncbi:MAG: mechanosensitive ion channel domain-containing protein [Pirellulales bacterium]